MNVMRKLLGGGGGAPGAGGGDDLVPSSPSSQQEPDLLGLNHLRKMYQEYSNPVQAVTTQQSERKLYSMLPLFCKIFNSLPPQIIMEKFPEAPSFALAVSKLFVTEIRRQASSKTTESAATSIVEFLQLNSLEDENSSRGWMLISTLNLLASAGDKVIEVLTGASVPSTLIKCLYLFFDLPQHNSDESTGESDLNPELDTQFTTKEKELLLQKIFIQILNQLCCHLPAVEDLARKDDLTLLFSAISTVATEDSNLWRKTSSEILKTVSRHTLSQSVISYLHNKGCIDLCVENIQKVISQKLSFCQADLVEFFSVLFSFLRNSSDVSKVLWDDFKICQGYGLLTDILLHMERDGTPENREAVENLVSLVSGLTYIGEDKSPEPTVTSSLYQLPDFCIPEPEDKGFTVKNLNAFQVLQTVLLRSSSDFLGGAVLDVISSIYHADHANYFILQNQNTLSQVSEKIVEKPSSVQQKFFQLVEFPVHQLHYIPTKELIGMSRILKDLKEVECSILAVQTLTSILRSHTLFKDVYREVGMLEVLVSCLSMYITNMESETEKTKDVAEDSDMQVFGDLVIKIVTDLVSGSQANAGIFWELDGFQLSYSLVISQRRQEAGFQLLQQLIVSAGSWSEDCMKQLLDRLQDCSRHDLQFQTDILACLTSCLKESHKCRTNFRKRSGFQCLVSVLLGLSGSLDKSDPVWSDTDAISVVKFVQEVIITLASAMRYEPANVKYFSDEIEDLGFKRALLGIGCFNCEGAVAPSMMKPNESLLNKFHSIFTNSDMLGKENDEVMPMLRYSCLIFRMLYDLSIDNIGSGTNTPTNMMISIQSPRTSVTSEPSEDQSQEGQPPALQQRRKTFSLDFYSKNLEPMLVHPKILVVMLQLIPHMRSDDPTDSVILQLFSLETVKSLLRNERNQQIVSEEPFVVQVLNFYSEALVDDTHLLHSTLKYLVERLSTQKIGLADLRTFLRLGQPLLGDAVDAKEVAKFSTGSVVPLSTTKSLVSMLLAQDMTITNCYVFPSFVEFNMSAEGFGCLYIPNLSPQPVKTGTNPGQNVTGGIGQGERVFPPVGGLSYSTWICVSKFSDPRVDPHPVRLLTISKDMKGPSETTVVCLSVVLSSRDKAIVISVQEHPFEQASDWQPEFNGEYGARIWCPDVIKEGEWHHLLVTIGRNAGKNQALCVYVNGVLVSQNRMNYIKENPLEVGQFSVCGWIGTAPCWRKRSKLVWRQGPCVLVEEVINSSLAGLLYRLGPYYLGSLQAPQVGYNNDVLKARIAEEKILLGLNSVSITEMTLSAIRKVYGKVDGKSIAKQLGMTSNENATPIKVLHNSSSHLQGASRSFGGVLIGYLGVRCFTPQPVSKVIQMIGGCKVMLGLIAMARDSESLYMGVKSLVHTLKFNPSLSTEMVEINGYQNLAMLFRKKHHMLSINVLNILFDCVQDTEENRYTDKELKESITTAIFRDIMCDLELWHLAPVEVEKLFYSKILSVISSKPSLCKVLRDFYIVEKLMIISRKIDITLSTHECIMKVLYGLLRSAPRVSDVLCYVQFAAATIFSDCDNEKQIKFSTQGEDGTDLASAEAQSAMLDPNDSRKISCIILRNKLLRLFLQLLFTSDKKINEKYCEELLSVIGFDWILLFLQEHVHSTTVVLTLRILTILLSIPSLRERFKVSSCNGGWISKSETLQQMLNSTVHASSLPKGHTHMSIQQDAFTVPGYQMLNWLIRFHVYVPEVYLCLLSLITGVQAKPFPRPVHLDKMTVWKYVFGKDCVNSPTTKIPGIVSSEAVILVLSVLRTLLNQEVSSTAGPATYIKDECPVILVQFLLQLYHGSPRNQAVLMEPGVLTALTLTLVPTDPSSSPVSANSTPDGSEHSQGETLKQSQIREEILNFIRDVIIDSLSLPPAKNNPLVDCICKPSGHTNKNRESVTSERGDQQDYFQNDVLTLIMDHLVTADIFAAEKVAIPIVQGGSGNNVMGNVFYLVFRMVDKMWQGVFKKDPRDIFKYILLLINQAKKRSSSPSIEEILSSLNRTILYILSRPLATELSWQVLLETLKKLSANGTMLFGRDNPELEFFGCLTFCLLQLIQKKEVPLVNIEPVDDENGDEVDAGEACAADPQLKKSVHDCVTKIWDSMYFNKKSSIEEVAKVSLPYGNKTPSLESVRNILEQPTKQIWFQYLEMELTAKYHRIPPWEIHTQIESKIRKFAGGLKRLTSVTVPGKVKKDEVKKIEISYHKCPEVMQAVKNNLIVVSRVVDQNIALNVQRNQHMFSFLEEVWNKIETQLTQERGLWGPNLESRLIKWRLDELEGPFRMRKRMSRDDTFYLRYPYKEEVSGNAMRYKRPTSRDSKQWHVQHQSIVILEREDKELALEYDDCDVSVEDPSTMSLDDQLRQISLKNRSSAQRNSSVEQSEDGTENNGGEEGEEQGEDGVNKKSPMVEELSSGYQTVMRMIDKGEKIDGIYNCARILGLDVVEGLLLLGRESCYLIDGFTIINKKEVHDIDFIPKDQFNPIIPIVPGQTSNTKMKRKISKFTYENVKEIHKRRYLLQNIALEIFLKNGQNYFLAFHRKDKSVVNQRLSAIVSNLLENTELFVTVTGSVDSHEASSGAGGGGLLSTLIGETSVTEKWLRGDITNFQYLMELNTLAGRTYNDLMQYPVFPWVVADYTSEELDLTNPKTFRDLSKPMGAQTQKRLDEFIKRYREWDENSPDSAPYHYGTHYSSAMIVSSFLVRLEPFTQHFLHLQGGHFDLADRMFHSVAEAWESSSKNNMADVRELIPEFFYLPDFLMNKNNFDLGTKQNGEILGGVKLPAWAKNDPREFIRVHREALESDYVTANLHHWIDLIFGYKQQGETAAENHNVFHHLFYEGNVDIFNIEDPLQRNATISFINNFGQIPKFLFKKPHPARKVSSKSGSEVTGTTSTSKIFFHNLTHLTPTMTPLKELKGPVGQISVIDKTVQAVEQNKVFVPGSSNEYLSWGYADHSFRFVNIDTDKVSFLCEPNCFMDEILACNCPTQNVILTAGTSSLVNVWFYQKKKSKLQLKFCLTGHTEPVICLTSSSSWGIAVSGSKDTTAIIWDITRFTYVKTLSGHKEPVAAVHINDMTGDIVTCSGSMLHLWDINGNPVALVDTALSSPVDNTSSQMKNYTLLCAIQSHMSDWDRLNVIITGGSDGVVNMWSLDYLEVPSSVEDNQNPSSDEKEDKTSLDESFVVINPPEAGKKVARDPSGDGYSWSKQLVHRGTLTLHTAFHRPDNKEPAAITSLAVSKDHRALFVGDERGRVYSWTVSNKPGKGFVDHWVRDECSESCKACKVKFTMYERRHHCRNCGNLFCSSCSKYKAQIPRLKIHDEVRVCRQCMDILISNIKEINTL